MTLYLKKNYFTGASNISGKEDGALADVVRKIVQSQARERLASTTAITDSSGGTVNTSLILVAQDVALAAHTADGATADAAPKAGFDTAIGKHLNAVRTLQEVVNPVLSKLGLATISGDIGGTNGAGTIAALDVALTAVDGSSATCLERVSALARLTTIRTDISILAAAVNRIAVAVGSIKLTDNSGGNNAAYAASLALSTITSTSAGVATTADGTILDADVDAQLVIIAANIATIARAFNRAMQVAPTALTDNSGGTSDGTQVAAIADVVAFTVTGTDLSPKAAWDTEMPKVANNIADLTAKVNEFAVIKGLTSLTDSSGGTANNTLEVIDDTLTAVDGAGDTGLAYTSSAAIITVIKNAIASITAKVNEVAPLYGIDTLEDNSSGTASSTIAVIGTSGTGVDGTLLSGVADTAMDAILDSITDAMATLAAKLNAIQAQDIGEVPLAVVAFDE